MTKQFVTTCPNCKKNNQFEAKYSVTCCSCEKVFEVAEREESGFFKNLLIFSALAGGGVYSVDAYKDYRRYDVAVEYAILKLCSEEKREKNTLSLYYNQKKNDQKVRYEVCECALKSTQDKVTYSDYQSEGMKFMHEFESNFKKCWLDKIDTIEKK